MDRSWQVVVMYIMTHLSLIFFLYPRNIIASSNEGHWMLIVVGLIIHFIIITVYTKGLNYCPNKDIISIYLGVGKGVAVLFLLPITVFFIAISIITVRAYSEIILITFLSKTPLWSILTLLFLVSAYLASKGVEVIFRTGVLIACLFFPLIILIFCSSFQNTDWHYAFPIMNKQFSFFTNSSFYVSFFAIGGSFLFLGFIQPFLTFQRKKIFLGAIILIPCYILAVYIPLLTFGQNTASTLMYPLVMALDTVELNWLMFDRVTSFFLLSLITFTMLFISLFLWNTVRIFNTCFPSIKPIYFILSITIFNFIISLLIPDWDTIEKLFVWNSFLRFFVMFAVPISVYFCGKRLWREGNIGKI
ncbi:hypothetical protein CN692_18475 [Bacillus sp. AFS002410]|uniref:GerAB/ArcD/ProY family transporter n=1 Tax=Bacillus sp. AFS002410 TaxID=2033481 RepID=UPI000BF0FAE0|nr:GerAB/ArcD/ProY family transporter [Bacillus sp. AFS002410]PEJ56318.1 hypothetical protein CN692_18475 [Bacillus sp. AFS002410]